MADASLGCGEAGDCGSAALPERCGKEGWHPVGDVSGHPCGQGVDGVAGGNAFSRRGYAFLGTATGGSVGIWLRT
jgi:hypothetical protein